MEPVVHFFSDTVGQQKGDIPVLLTEENASLESIFLVLIKTEQVKEFFSKENLREYLGKIAAKNTDD